MKQIEEFDHLPKCVCTECWNKTEDFHNFYQFVQTTQTTYLNKNRNVEQKCQFDQIFVEDLVKVADEIENEIKCENENNLEAIEFVETNTPIVEFPKKTERICDDLGKLFILWHLNFANKKLNVTFVYVKKQLILWMLTRVFARKSRISITHVMNVESIHERWSKHWCITRESMASKTVISSVVIWNLKMNKQ